ncbi:unnamed protein product [Clavelina lepadiformis]|uniref:F5/8 type C domain-containing protein n=1 Tax=Clavelina lepadiformis TaxID=159417 RepID=A0ABP0EVV2_CLALP
MGVFIDENAIKKEFCLAGVKSGKVRDDEMTASSINNQSYAAHEGRLDGGRYWYPHLFNFQTPGEWLQVDLRTPTTVTGVVTQGGGDFPRQLRWYQSSGKCARFDLNTDSTNHVQNLFPNPIRAKYFTLIAVTFHVGIDLRLDYLTC